MRKIFLTLVLSTIAFMPAFAKKDAEPSKDFTGKTIDGKEIQLSDFRGKVVVLDFWASWCAPCRKEFPFLVKVYNKFHEAGLVVIGINLDEQSTDRNKFLAKINRPVLFPIIADAAGKLPELYRVEGMPTTVFIDKHGKVRFRHTGFKEADKRKYLQEIRILLGEK